MQAVVAQFSFLKRDHQLPPARPPFSIPKKLTAFLSDLNSAPKDLFVGESGSFLVDWSGVIGPGLVAKTWGLRFKYTG